MTVHDALLENDISFFSVQTDQRLLAADTFYTQTVYKVQAAKIVHSRHVRGCPANFVYLLLPLSLESAGAAISALWASINSGVSPISSLVW